MESPPEAPNERTTEYKRIMYKYIIDGRTKGRTGQRTDDDVRTDRDERPEGDNDDGTDRRTEDDDGDDETRRNGRTAYTES